MSTIPIPTRNLRRTGCERYEFVMENFGEKIQLAEVSALANMTESAFSRYFKSRMNKTFSVFLMDVRIAHACKLLHEVDRNISEISLNAASHASTSTDSLRKNGCHADSVQEDFAVSGDQGSCFRHLFKPQTSAMEPHPPQSIELSPP